MKLWSVKMSLLSHKRNNKPMWTITVVGFAMKFYSRVYLWNQYPKSPPKNRKINGLIDMKTRMYTLNILTKIKPANRYLKLSLSQNGVRKKLLYIQQQ